MLAALLFALAVSGCGEPEADPDLSPGVSRALAEHRARTLSDVRYDLAFRVPRDTAEAVRGRVRVRFRLSGPGPVALDFDAEPGRLQAVAVDGDTVDATLENGHLVIPADAVREGPNEVRIEFTSADDPLNRGADFLYTLFVPDRAHRAFPSFDQPDLKARFRLALTVPSGWAAVSNGAGLADVDDAAEGADADDAAARRGADGAEGPDADPPGRAEWSPAGAEPWPEEEARGMRTHRFAPTPPLPTYLFAFAAGEFQVEEARRAGRRIRLFHRETDSVRVARNREAIFDLHGRALEWLEAYTGIDYPFGKFDVVAVPAFQYSGMEHPGAILYGAESLFLDPSATQVEELGRASVIAHETAHMWFGDLVTMEWFSDVWMKEVFANFMAAKIVHPSFPEVDHDLRFLLAHYPAAYAVDRTAGANPIRQELDNLSEAGTLYGAIIYQKAPIVMKHLELLLGQDALREGLRRYLEEHAFGNAGWPHLVRILDGLTPTDLATWSEVWVERPGRPTVRTELRLDEDGGGRSRIASLSLVQEDPRGRPLAWSQPLQVRIALGDSVRRLPVRLDGKSVRVGPARGLPAPHWLLANGDGVGYGYFPLEPRTRRWMLGNLERVREPIPRAVAWLSLWDDLLEGRVAADSLLATAVRTLEREPVELIADQVLEGVGTLYWRFLPPARREAWAPRLEALLWSRMEAAGDESARATWFRAWRGLATTPESLRRMEALWAGRLEVPGLELSERDFTRLAEELAVRGVANAAEILDRQATRIENPDRRARFAFVRPALSADPAIRDSFFRSLAVAENRRREPWVVDAVAWLHHPLRARSALPYIRPSLEMLEEIQRTGDIFFPGRWLDATLSGHASPEAAGIVESFLDARPDLPSRLREKVLQSADLLFRVAPR